MRLELLLGMSYILYVDEAGSTGDLPHATSNIQPVFCIVGLIVPQRHVRPLTEDFLALKRQHFPQIANRSHDLDLLLHEIKGADLRSRIRNDNRNRRRHTIRVIEKCFDLLEHHSCQLLGRAYVKSPAVPFKGREVYTSAIQMLCDDFQAYLESKTAKGLIIADSRNKAKNSQLSFSIFTKKYRSAGDQYPNLLEMPTFGHSENHVGLQVADWLASAVLFPAITHVYCTGFITSVHIHPKDQVIKARFSRRLNEIQYRYHDGKRYRGGVTVIDGILKTRSAGLLFQS